MRRLIGPHTLHECAQCGGLWIDKKGFQDICKREEEQEAVLSFRFTKETKSGESRIRCKRAYIPCPECGKLMNHKNFYHCSGIVLDWCRDHGSWLDKRELYEIVAFIRNGGLKKAREGERRKLREETARLRMQRFDLAVRSNRATGLSADMPDLDHPGISLLKFLQETLSD